MSDVTHILEAIERGDPKAADQLLPLVYEELRKLAAQKMAHEAAGHTLQPTALVHEAWLRLVGSGHEKWNSRGHFFSAAAEAMRRILIEAARRKSSQRRGGGLERVDLDDSQLFWSDLPMKSSLWTKLSTSLPKKTRWRQIWSSFATSWEWRCPKPHKHSESRRARPTGSGLTRAPGCAWRSRVANHVDPKKCGQMNHRIGGSFGLIVEIYSSSSSVAL